MLPFKLVYHPGYNFDLGDHVFPAIKYSLVRKRLIDERVATPDDFAEPESVADSDCQLAHSVDWIKRLRSGLLTFEEAIRLEIPYTADIIRGFWLATGGTLLASRLALRDRLGFNIGGGFHHAYADHGEGFCAINDVAIAIRKLQHEGSIQTAMVVDVDVHHGNGTAAIFQSNPSVFTLSIHQLNNYPEDKPPSTLDIHLDDGTGDEEYLDLLSGAYLTAIKQFRPDLLVYVAGADPHASDRLGGLSLTLDGLARRDRLVFDTALSLDVPVAVVLAGGYSEDVNDTVSIHCNTVKAARDALRRETRRSKV